MASRPKLRPVRVALLGATGRMGAAIVEALAQSPASALSAAATHAQSAQIGCTLAGTELAVTSAAEAVQGVDVAIDFSLPEATQLHIDLCREHQVAYVSGVTGLSNKQKQALESLAADVPVLWSANMSLAVSACLQAAAQLASSYAAGVDVHILDIHHVNKKDAPSGTALAFGEAIMAANSAARVTYDSRREGAHPGEHIISYSSADELIELRHRAGSRDRFAQGAVLAAQWLSERPPGLYKMSDLLNFTSSS